MVKLEYISASYSYRLVVSLSTHASPSLTLPSVPDLSGLNTFVAMIFKSKHMKHHVSREVSSRVTMRGGVV